ncbi:methyltransferase family protein [Roseimicrobium gellanilyticum]|uniref:Methyltransferase family protein n=1 Tax=Roseimicrobium gellanilyticum TaxID=748857 RepID=A0A366HDD9_9BACT|nr:class I SAM-dependent methyltransferase [Roseimicrobium gellanilyticum]RBP40472.1 methyltransferase family protein [Roseimicrobium gellanilyticum]
MSDVSRDPEKRFSNRVADYVKYRPGYPDGILELLREKVGLSARSMVADIGSGTGISAEFLLQVGCTVHAVEPNADMRAAAELMLSGRAGFHSVAGAATATTLPERSVDLVVAAQAFHWFAGEATRAEFDRILKPEGWVALIWNVRKVDSTPFLVAYEALLLKHATDYGQVRHELVDDKVLASFFRDGKFSSTSFPNAQYFDYDGLKGRLLSSSYAPAVGQAGHEEMMAELERIFREYEVEGKVAIDYDTWVHLGR